MWAPDGANVLLTEQTPTFFNVKVGVGQGLPDANRVGISSSKMLFGIDCHIPKIEEINPRDRKRRTYEFINAVGIDEQNKTERCDMAITHRVVQHFADRHGQSDRCAWPEELKQKTINIGGIFMKNPSLQKQVQNELDSKLAIGQSRHEKKKENEDSKYIFSWTTYRNYLKHLCYFVKFVKDDPQVISDLGRKPHTLEECKPYCDLWIKDMLDRHLSASTISMCASALVKLYQCSREELGIKDIVPEQIRENIKRSRTSAVRDKNFNEDIPHNKEFADFCRATGLRRREVEQIRGSDLVWDKNKWFLSVTCNTKGGRPRLSEIVGTDEQIYRVVEICKAAGESRIYPKPNTNADIHSFRAEYASRIYRKYARAKSEYRNERMIFYKGKLVEKYTSKSGKADVDRFSYLYTGRRTIKGMPEMKPGYSDVPSMYRCRKDMTGVVLDREAIFIASEALGHGRDDVIPEHYMWS